MASTGLRKRCWIAGVTWKGDICGTHSEESGVIGEDAGVGLRVFLLSRGVTLAWCRSAMVVPFGHGGATFGPWSEEQEGRRYVEFLCIYAVECLRSQHRGGCLLHWRMAPS